MPPSWLQVTSPRTRFSLHFCIQERSTLPRRKCNNYKVAEELAFNLYHKLTRSTVFTLCAYKYRNEQQCKLTYLLHNQSWMLYSSRCTASQSDPQTCQPPKHANLEMLKKSPEKPGDWDLKPGDFQNMC